MLNLRFMQNYYHFKPCVYHESGAGELYIIDKPDE